MLDDLILAAFIGGMINVAVQGFSGNIESAGDFWLSFGIGALGGLAGGMAGQAVASAISIGGAAAGAAIGATAGGISGFTVSSGNAWMNDANFLQGLAAGSIGLGIGAVSGGIVGGLSGGINARMHGGNFWNGDGYIEVLASENSLGVVEKKDSPLTQEKIIDYLRETETWWPGKDRINRVETEAGLSFDVGNETYYRGNDGILYKLKNGVTTKLGGFTKYTRTGGINNYYLEIHMSPFNTLRNFSIAFNHELIHSHHYNTVYAVLSDPKLFMSYTETSAYANTQLYYPQIQLPMSIPAYNGPLNIYNWPKKMLPVSLLF